LKALHTDLSAEETMEDSLNVTTKKVFLLFRDCDSSTLLNGSLPLGLQQTHKDKMLQKSIHHFCVVPDGLQMPAAYRGVWHQHHRTMVSEVSDLVQ